MPLTNTLVKIFDILTVVATKLPEREVFLTCSHVMDNLFLVFIFSFSTTIYDNPKFQHSKCGWYGVIQAPLELASRNTQPIERLGFSPSVKYN